MAGASKRLEELIKAGGEYFKNERKRLEAEYSFLDSISKKRGGNASLQDKNAESASKILANSIDDYLGRPPSPEGG